MRQVDIQDSRKRNSTHSPITVIRQIEHFPGISIHSFIQVYAIVLYLTENKIFLF